MRNLIMALALMLVGTFAFANNSVETKLNIEETIEVSNNNEVNKMDYNSFTEMLQNGNVVEVVFEDGSFLFLDDCGNWWIVEYSGMSGFQAFLTASYVIAITTGC